MIDVKKIFVECGALLEGHFLLSSGLHSQFYMQSAKVLQNVKIAEQLGNMIADRIKDENLECDFVVSPALGGIIIGHETARALNKNFIFTERENGKMSLKRGFVLPKNAKIIIVEDVFTTGKSTKEVINLMREFDGVISACCCIVDRSGGVLKFDAPKISLLTMDIKNYEPNNCELCKKNTKLEKLGSRIFLSK